MMPMTRRLQQAERLSNLLASPAEALTAPFQARDCTRSGSELAAIKDLGVSTNDGQGLWDIQQDFTVAGTALLRLKRVMDMSQLRQCGAAKTTQAGGNVQRLSRIEQRS